MKNRANLSRVRFSRTPSRHPYMRLLLLIFLFHPVNFIFDYLRSKNTLLSRNRREFRVRIGFKLKPVCLPTKVSQRSLSYICQSPTYDWQFVIKFKFLTAGCLPSHMIFQKITSWAHLFFTNTHEVFINSLKYALVLRKNAGILIIRGLNVAQFFRLEHRFACKSYFPNRAVKLFG